MHFTQHFALQSLHVRILFLCLHWLIYYVTYDFFLKVGVKFHGIICDLTQARLPCLENAIPEGLHSLQSLSEPLAIALHHYDDEDRFTPLLRGRSVLDKVALLEIEDFKE